MSQERTALSKRGQHVKATPVKENYIPYLNKKNVEEAQKKLDKLKSEK